MDNNFDIEDYRPYADKHRGKYVRSGPHWPLVLRYPILFDEVERLTIELKSKEIIIKGQREQINRFAAKLQKEHELSDALYLLLVDNPDTKLLADKILISVKGEQK